MKNVMENQYRKKPNRLAGFDYSTPGYYFITICTKNHLCLLGKIVSENELIPAVMELNTTGQIVQAVAEEIPYHYPGAKLDKYTIMPNHVHMILVLNDSSPTGPSIHRIIQQYKRTVSIRIGEPIWQPRFYDHIIRSEREYQEIWKYIDNNPAKWALDKYYHEMQRRSVGRLPTLQMNDQQISDAANERSADCRHYRLEVHQ